MNTPVNLLDLNKEEFQTFLDSFDHVFSDCDGVIWTNAALPGVGDFFKLMKKHGKTVNFVSNNSIRTKENYDARFKDADIENGFENLIIPSVAIAEYLKSVNFKKTVYSVACAETIKMLRSYGFKCEEGPDVALNYYGGYFDCLKDDEEIGAVVFDSDIRINLPKIHKSIVYLKRPEVLFLAGATDAELHYKDGSNLKKIIGTGVFTDMVATETSRKPVLLGKPGKMLGEFAMKKAGVTNPSRVLFIGDMIAQDVGLGKASGFQTLLLLTHVTVEKMLAQDQLRPDFYAPSLESIVPALENNL